MKRTLTILFFGLAFGNIFGQVKTFHPDTSEACNPKTIFVIVEKAPEYKGGLSQLELDLNEKLTFDKKTSGSIYASVFINCENFVYAVQVLRGIDEQTDSKLIEGLKMLQNWTSGKQHDKPVNCSKLIGFKIKRGRLTITDK
ncbi:MAG: hypothetical protein AB2L24_08480 [Mangrovibacterium sp.]